MIRMKTRIDFTPRNVRYRVSAANKKVLSRQGAYVRGGIRRKIRYRKNPDKHSVPGSSPFTHDGTLKKSIWFAIDQSSETVVIGPAFNWAGTIGKLHEEGGTVSRTVQAGGWKPDKKFKIGDIGPVSTSRYKRAYVSRFRRPLYDPLTGSQVAYVRIKSSTQAAHATRLNRRIARSQTKQKMVTYPARPFVRPGFEETKPRLASLWANAV